MCESPGKELGEVHDLVRASEDFDALIGIAWIEDGQATSLVIGGHANESVVAATCVAESSRHCEIEVESFVDGAGAIHDMKLALDPRRIGSPELQIRGKCEPFYQNELAGLPA